MSTEGTLTNLAMAAAALLILYSLLDMLIPESLDFLTTLVVLALVPLAALTLLSVAAHRAGLIQ